MEKDWSGHRHKPRTPRTARATARELQEARKVLSCRFQREGSPAHMLIRDFWAPELQEFVSKGLMCAPYPQAITSSSGARAQREASCLRVVGSGWGQAGLMLLGAGGLPDGPSSGPTQAGKRGARWPGLSFRFTR